MFGQSVAQNSSVISFDSFEITNPLVGLYDVSHISVDTKQFDLFDKSSNNHLYTEQYILKI